MPVLMKTDSDCQFAAIATACGVTYDQAKAAFYPLPRLDPIDSNPEACYLALARLGLWKRNITWSDLEAHRAEPGKTVIFIHGLTSPTLNQHIIVLQGYKGADFSCWWGGPIQPGRDPNIPVIIPVAEMKKLYLGGSFNCAFQVVQDTWWKRLWRRFGYD